MLIGSRISGRYKILRMIGGGGMANVYLARDIILDRDVAIKILRLDFANEDEFIRRFQREAQSATSLTHENIVSIYDVGEEKDIYYIVMEFVDGMTLKQYIQQNHPIPIEKTLDIMKQLTAAITHAHQNHIVHRDIKPQNILINHHGHVMITDFGIAMALSATSITQTNAVLGSVHYLSPEQARGGMATEKSDIYSIGIVMFELLTGRLPFSGESAVSIALKHLQSETPSPSRWNPDIPQSIENIVLKATSKDPFVRYENTDEMEQDLETALDPKRLQEPKFFIPEDVDATKAIPVITGESLQNHGQTILHNKEPIVQGQKNTKKTKKQKVKKQKKRKKWPWVVGIITLLLALGVLFFQLLLPEILASQNVKVPALSGEEYDDAVLQLVDAGLEVGEIIDTNSDEFVEGEVIRTSPKEGREVKKGSPIDIYLSIGKEKVTLEDYTGRQYEEIVTLLDNAGFKKIIKEEQYDESPEGTILSQSPDGETEVIPGETELTFVVSIGEEKITVPDLSGYNAKGLESFGVSSGLNINMANEAYSDTVAEGLVISQEPGAGAKLSKGSQVKVVISKGKEVIPPEVVTIEVTIPYEPVEEGQEQEIKILIEDMNNSMTVPAKTFMITETVVEELQFTIEPGKKAGYKIVRDNSVIEEQDVEIPQ